MKSEQFADFIDVNDETLEEAKIQGGWGGYGGWGSCSCWGSCGSCRWGSCSGWGGYRGWGSCGGWGW